ncbi:MAG: DUF429 domain-containing protein [Verrucomicrobiota bacterium]
MKDFPTIFGIDLAWGEKNPDGIARLVFDSDRADARLVEAEVSLSFGDVSLLDHLPEAGAGLCFLAIDAPLICPNETGSRPVDRECSAKFRSFEAGAHPANQKLCRRPLRIAGLLRERGFAITTQLGSSSRVAAEVYPHPATLRFFELNKTIKYKRGLVADRRREFARYQCLLRDWLDREIPGMTELSSIAECLSLPWSKPIEDQTDAILCAVIGWHHVRYRGRQSEVLGDDESGHMIIPAPSVGGRPNE